MLLFSLTLFATVTVATTVFTLDWICQHQWFHYAIGPPNRLVPFSACAPLAVPFAFLGCTIFGNLGAFVPDRPGDPVNDLENLSLPMAMCGLTTVAMLPALVAPAVACSCTLRMITSLIFIVSIYLFDQQHQTVYDIDAPKPSISFYGLTFCEQVFQPVLFFDAE